LPPRLPLCYFALMRRYCIWLTTGCLLALAAQNVAAANGKIFKALPQFLDKKGQASLSPSLLERDAYQFYLRRNPANRLALQLAVQWKASDVDWSKMKLRAELRGVLGHDLNTTTLESPVQKGGFFAPWTYFKIGGDDYKKFGELVAWRVTLWEGDKQIASEQSFLWSGVAAKD
jgi:hypothetical protein